MIYIDFVNREAGYLKKIKPHFSSFMTQIQNLYKEFNLNSIQTNDGN